MNTSALWGTRNASIRFTLCSPVHKFTIHPRNCKTWRKMAIARQILFHTNKIKDISTDTNTNNNGLTIFACKRQWYFHPYSRNYQATKAPFPPWWHLHLQIWWPKSTETEHVTFTVHGTISCFVDSQKHTALVLMFSCLRAASIYTVISTSSIIWPRETGASVLDLVIHNNNSIWQFFLGRVLARL